MTVPAVPMPDVPGVEHIWVDAGGLNMHVAVAGAGAPLVMLHGWPENWFIYRQLIGPLAEHYRVYVPDLRGWGWTEAPAGGYDKAQMSEDVANLFAALELREARLIGHDWGSLFGFRLCLEHPELVARYLVLGGFLPWQHVDGPLAAGLPRFWYQALVATPRLGARAVAERSFIRLIYQQWSAPSFRWSEAQLDALTGQFDDPARAEASSQVYRCWLTRELVPMVAGQYRNQILRTPTMVLHGALDRCISPAYARPPERFADLMSYEVLPGVGHFVPAEAPELVLRRALPFFQ